MNKKNPRRFIFWLTIIAIFIYSPSVEGRLIEPSCPHKVFAIPWIA